ncbi:MAG: peptidase MA family metallohydrolase [Chloroflexota bacterium]
MPKRIHYFLLSMILLLVLLTPPPAFAQASIEITEQKINSWFRRSMSAQLRAEHDVDITQVEFFYRDSLDAVTLKDVVDFEPNTQIRVNYNLNRLSFSLPPGAEIEYWWRLTDSRGDTLTTEPTLYQYKDNRFEFKVLENDRLTLFWYTGRQAFGQALFRQANSALDRLERDINVSIERPIKIYIYGNHRDLMSSISVGAREWTGGVAYSDHGVIVIGISPDNLDWGLRAMTHELTHLVVHDATDNPFGGLPTWLNEGIAVYNESPDVLEPEFREVVDEAVANNTLPTLRSLSSGFPADAQEARLAYGQSGAVFHFMINTYGTEAMAQLLAIFSEGTVPDKALEEALGEDTWSLDNAFRASLGLPPLPTLPSAQPPPASNDEANVATTDANDASPQTSDDVIEKPQPDGDASPPISSSNSLLARCLGGLLPLVFLGLFVTQPRRSVL